MSDEQKRPYEGLFLFPQALAADLQAAVNHIDEILSRNGADVMSLQKWDERRLAFEIKGNKRGVYFLVYFKVQAPSMRDIERDCNLSERMLRFMFLRADHVPQEVIDAAEGREALADEIRLRGEQAQRADEDKSDDRQSDDRDSDERASDRKAAKGEPVEVNVESVADATSSVER